ncbi:MAG: L-aspartate oxidase, partial [Alphaproteobacteria bacterium]
MKAVIIGAGLAGLTTALSLAPMPVIVLSAKKLGEGISSGWSQGGIAAAVGSHDTAQLHAADTLKAGAGLSDASIARQVTEDGASIIDQLINTGVNFDRDEEGRLRLGLEAAHSQRRIVHAAGDGTGAAIMKALIRAVKLMPSIEVIEDACASDILTHSGAVSGVLVEIKGKASIIPTNAVVLATGGAGALWQHTTNPLSSWGQGLALAARAGAVLGDLEFMQFHPTAIDCGRDPMPLASEALRGEGALLIDENNQRFVDELQPRDIVARAIWQHMQKGHRVFLDARQSIGSSFSKRFPSIYASCMTAHIDPSLHPIPVRPAAHYHMGGVMTGAEGRSTVEGLWACGEVACTGLHGANRLA